MVGFRWSGDEPEALNDVELGSATPGRRQRVRAALSTRAARPLSALCTYCDPLGARIVEVQLTGKSERERGRLRFVAEKGGGEAPQRLVVTEDQRRVLEEWVARGDDGGLARRAQIILGASEGLSNAEVARQLDVSRPTVTLWRRRFAEGGLPAVASIKGGRGRRPSLPPHKTRLILEAARRPPPPGKSRWTVRAMADYAGVSPDTVQRLWRDHGIRPAAAGPPVTPRQAPRQADRTVRSGAAGAPPYPASEARAGGDLPRPLSSFVGRRRELAEIEELAVQGGLVTLTGGTGIGKSRLALETATRLAPAYEGQAWFVELTPVAEPRFVPHAVAAALGVSEYPNQSVADTLTAALRHRRLLLVLDNCEHVLPGCAELVAKLLAACPELTVLATSQERLGIPGERRWSVPPLALPAPAGDRAASEEEPAEAIRLFCERARAQSESFSLTPDTAADVAELCRRLDGNPLAIELAAARAVTMGPSAILARLEQRFRVLTSDGWGRPDRHRTLEAAIAWSFDLLSEAQQVLLRRLSVFEGGITLEAAEHVCADEGLLADEVFYLLAGLVERSLVVAEVAGRQARYRLLETIGQFARDRLEEAGEAEEVGSRFAGWCRALVEQAEPGLTGSAQLEWRARLEAEHDNIVAAIERMLSDGRPEEALCVAGAMATFWQLGRHSGGGLALLDRCLDEAPPDADTELQGKAASGAARLAAILGDLSTAQTRAEQSVHAAEHGDDDALTACALTVLGAVTMYRGEPTAAAELLDRGVAAARRAQDTRRLSEALDRCGQAHMLHGRPRRAVPLFDEACEVARQLGDRHAEASALIGRGWAAMEVGDYEVGEERIRLAEAHARALRDRWRTGETLVFLGELSRRRGEYDDAERQFCECRQLAQAMGAPLLEARSLGGLGRVALARQRYTAACACFREGLAIARTIGLPYVQTRMLLGSSACRQAMGDHASAEAAVAEALDIARRNDDLQGTATALYSTASMARDQGNLEHAGTLLTEALSLHVEAGDTETIVRSLQAFAGIALDQERFIFAARLFGAAHAASESSGCDFARWPREQQRHERDIARLEEVLGAEGLRRSWQAGAEQSLDKAVAAVLRPRSGRRRVSNGDRGTLTDSEWEVARLVVHGLTSREVAERLFVSPRTIDAHLGRIYRKLGINSRQQLRDLADRLPGLQSVDA